MSGKYKTENTLKVAVLAGNHQQYIQFCRERGLSPNCDAAYINRSEVMAGSRFSEYVWVGTCGDLPGVLIDEFRQHQSLYGQRSPS